MPRTRKLFPIYGSALANNMLAALVHDRVVPHFVASYVAEYDRRGILGGPAREGELAETIGREILLGLVVETRDLLPRFYGKQHVSKLKDEEKQAVEFFFRELMDALARAANWSADERRQFRRDLKLHLEFRARQEAAAKNRARPKAQQEESPFIARVALLLDPSMLDQARRAAREFHDAIGPLAQKLLRRTLR